MGIEEQIMKCASFYITRYDKRRERWKGKWKESTNKWTTD
jgi:hypothetical protein